MEYRQNNAGRLLRLPRIDANNIGQDEEIERSIFSSEMEVAKLSASPNLKLRAVRNSGLINS